MAMPQSCLACARNDQRIQPSPRDPPSAAPGLGCRRSTWALTPYEELFEPPAPSSLPGATTHAPSPLVLSPERPVQDSPPFQIVSQGEEIAFRVVLIGDRARRWEAVVIAALREAGAEGFGSFTPPRRATFRGAPSAERTPRPTSSSDPEFAKAQPLGQVAISGHPQIERSDRDRAHLRQRPVSAQGVVQATVTGSHHQRRHLSR